MSRSAHRAAAGAAILLWSLLCLRWFDPAAPWRPAWLAAIPPALLAAAGLAALWLVLRGRVAVFWGTERPEIRRAMLWSAGLAVLLRMPLAWWGGAGYVTPDGALSGIVALHVGTGAEHLVFVPRVPYSGSLKSHLAAALSLAVDPARAFALASIFFYGLFAAAVCRLAGRVEGAPVGSALWAGLYVALAPAFVTRYSLSNDGNYVEVLALGTLALLVTDRWVREPPARSPLAWLIGLLLGLAFWCHILAVMYVAAVALVVLFHGRDALQGLVRIAVGFLLGDLPGLLWNAAHEWASFQYLLPGHPVGALEEGPGFAARAVGILRDQLPVLFGYDPGYPKSIDTALFVLGVLAALLTAAAMVSAAVRARASGQTTLRLLALFAGLNLIIAFGALPYIPGNARYLLFLIGPAAVWLSTTLTGYGRLLLGLLIAAGAATSVAQVPAALRADRQWRRFVADLQAEGVRWCYTDFYLATKIAFLSREAVTCSARLGPTTTEYFDEYRSAVEAAPEAALVAVNPTAAEKLERRLERLGVRYERRDLMKPVLLRLSRKVEPEDLFPSHPFPGR